MFRSFILLLLVVPISVSVADAQSSSPTSHQPSFILAAQSASVAGATSRDRAEMDAATSSSARSFATRVSDLHDEMSRRCRSDRRNCIITGALIGGSIGMFLGSRLSASPVTENEISSGGTIRKCVAHCDDKGYNAVRFAAVGVAIGVSTSLYLGHTSL
jgi:hypothetical protein